MYRIDWNKYLCKDRVRKSWSEEHPAINDKRTPFESDYGRVTFCMAIRRMHDKAQVIPLTSGDVVLTRLTHSLEVMNIVESLILNYCRSNDFELLYGKDSVSLKDDLLAVARSAAFVHDIGNPPFGHFGENVIQNYFKRKFEEKDSTLTEEQKYDFTQFDGNAQGLRVLSKLQYVGSLEGLNLTYATLGAYMKYPNIGSKSDKNNLDYYIGNKKHGVFSSEQSIFEKIVEACELRVNDKKIKRHPLSFLVEAADSIAYNVMDIDDGFNMGWFGFSKIVDFIDKYIQDKIGDDTFSILEHINYKNTLSGDPEESGKYEYFDDIRKLADFRFQMIDYLVSKAVQNFIKNLKGIDKGKYSKELIEDDDYKVSEALQEFTKRYIFPQKSIQLVEMTGKSVMEGLLVMLSDYAFSEDRQYRDKFKSLLSNVRLQIAMYENDANRPLYIFASEDMLNKFDIGSLDEYSRYRIIVDFISGMTDKFAVELYQKLSGQRL